MSSRQVEGHALLTSVLAERSTCETLVMWFLPLDTKQVLVNREQGEHFCSFVNLLRSPSAQHYKYLLIFTTFVNAVAEHWRMTTANFCLKKKMKIIQHVLQISHIWLQLKDWNHLGLTVTKEENASGTLITLECTYKCRSQHLLWKMYIRSSGHTFHKPFVKGVNKTEQGRLGMLEHILFTSENTICIIHNKADKSFW